MLCQKNQRQQLWQMQKQAATLKHHWYQRTLVMIPDLVSVLPAHSKDLLYPYYAKRRVEVGWPTLMLAVIHFKCVLSPQFDLVYRAYKQINR